MNPTNQLSLAGAGFLPKFGKQTCKAVFQAEIHQVVPWSRFEELIEPFYPKKGNWSPALCTILRIHFKQQWIGYSDPAVEDVVHYVQSSLQFAGLDAFKVVASDGIMFLRFRYPLARYGLAVAIPAGVNVELSEKSLLMSGTVLNAMRIAALSSIKNKDMKLASKGTQPEKGSEWYFGMMSRRRRAPGGRFRESGGHEISEVAQVANIGVNADSGFNHSFDCTTAKVSDIAMIENCLRWEESIALGDCGYRKKNRTIDEFQKEGNLSALAPSKNLAGGILTEEQAASKRMLSSVWAVVEHLYRLVKRQVGFVKVRYVGLAINTGQIVTLFALAKFLDRSQAILTLAGRGAPMNREIQGKLPKFHGQRSEIACFFLFVTACTEMVDFTENTSRSLLGGRIFLKG